MQLAQLPLFFILVLTTGTSAASELSINTLPLPLRGGKNSGIRSASQLEETAHFTLRTSYLARPLSVQSPGPSPEGNRTSVVEGAFIAEFADVVLLGKGWDIGAGFSSHIYQWGQGPSAIEGGDAPLPSFAMGPPRVELGWGGSHKNYFRYRPYFSLNLPLGSPGTFSGGDTFLAELGSSFVGQHNWLEWSAQAGLLLRSTSKFSATVWGPQLLFAAGIMARLSTKILIGPELHLQPLLSSQSSDDHLRGGQIFPAEFVGTLRYENSWIPVSLFAGTGIPLSKRASTQSRFVRAPGSPLFRLGVDVEAHF